MDNNKFNPALGISNFFPDDVASENFLLFLKAYYEWLQTTKIFFSTVTGTFVRDEIVIGSTSKSTGIIKEISADGSIVIKSTSTVSFNRYENVVGQTSGAIGVISQVKDNVVRKTGKLIDYRTIDNSVDKYVDFLKEELYDNIPKNVYGNAKDIALRYKDLYQSKSNEESYRFLLKHLYNQNSEFYYPGTDLLRVSDGKFEKTKIIRAAINPQIFSYINKTVVGKSSGALGNVIDIRKFFVGSIEIAEMTLTLVDGVFIAGETIQVLNDSSIANTSLYGMITGFTLNDAGSGYQINDPVSISGNGSEAKATVESIKQSPITALKVNSVGHGYRLNTTATINNSGTGGSGLIIRVTGLANTYTVTNGANSYTVGEVSEVSIINRGSEYYKKPSVTLEDAVISSLGLLSENLITISNAGTNYGVGNTLIFTGGSGSNAAGIVASVVETTTFDLKFEDDTKMIAETGKDIIKNEDWNVKGPISRIELTNYGTGYTPTNLPTITVSTTTGSSANLIATNIQGKSANVSIDVANNATGIGSIRGITVKDFGINYTTATANVSSYGDGNANLTPIISGLGVKEGNWISDDGKVNYKKIQDSYYYQDFSYVIKSGLVFNAYKDTVKKLLHPAGLQAFGEILLFNVLNVSPDFILRTETLREYIISVYNEFLADAAIVNSRYHWEVKQKSFANTASPLLNSKKYVVNLVPGGNRTKSVANTSAYDHFEIVVNSIDTLDSTLTEISAPLRKRVVSKKDTSLQDIATVSSRKFTKFIPNSANSLISVSDKLKYILPLRANSASEAYLGRRMVYLVPETNISAGYSRTLGQTTIGEVSDRYFFNYFQENEFTASVMFADATFDTFYATKTEITAKYEKILGKTVSNLSSNLVSSKLKYEHVLHENTSTNNTSKYLVQYRTSSDAILSFTNSAYARQSKISGTVSSITTTFANVAVDAYGSLPISLIFGKTFSDVASIVIGSGTSFTTNFASGNTFIADNQYFIVSGIANNTYMTVNVPATTPYSGVFAYKQLA
jgi:hypothetical protein